MCIRDSHVYLVAIGNQENLRIARDHCHRPGAFPLRFVVAAPANGFALFLLDLLAERIGFLDQVRIVLFEHASLPELAALVRLACATAGGMGIVVKASHSPQ